MKRQINYWSMGILTGAMIILGSCNDDAEEEPRELKRTYSLASVSDPSINGKVTFTKIDAGSTRVLIELTGTTAGNTHPAHIHENAASEGGPIAIDLSQVEGATGISETIVSQRNDGNAIAYEGLVNYDGHVNVHLSAMALSTLIAQGNIGSNQSGTGTPDNGGNGGY